MKLIRHVLSHLLLFMLLVAVGVVYFYRHQVMPERYVQSIDNFAEKIHPKLAEFSSQKDMHLAKQEESIQPENKIDVIYVDDVPLIDESVNKVAEKQKTTDTTTEVAEQQAEEAQAQVEESVQTSEVAETEAGGNEPSQETTESAIIQETTEQVAEVEEETSVSSDKEAADYLTVLRDARTAFSQGNMDLAVNKYNELIELENDEADFHGELGNVYYAMGKWNEAGAAYFEAATRLIENGNLAQVNYLQRVIQGLDAERAEKLVEKMAAQGQ